MLELLLRSFACSEDILSVGAIVKTTSADRTLFLRDPTCLQAWFVRI